MSRPLTPRPPTSRPSTSSPPTSSPAAPGLPAPGSHRPGLPNSGSRPPRRRFSSRLPPLLLKALSLLVALTGLLLTFFLARSGHETAGLVAVLTALVPLLLKSGRER
ncbi:hypothetical protein [Deinococcus altitudinis]|uniref:hypothetical protein n=1 Tax=Deinococcus altitudinis TaxID=468914 RepID=UPI003891EA27